MSFSTCLNTWLNLIKKEIISTMLINIWLSPLPGSFISMILFLIASSSTCLPNNYWILLFLISVLESQHGIPQHNRHTFLLLLWVIFEYFFHIWFSLFLFVIYLTFSFYFSSRTFLAWFLLNSLYSHLLHSPLFFLSKFENSIAFFLWAFDSSKMIFLFCRHTTFFSYLPFLFLEQLPFYFQSTLYFHPISHILNFITFLWAFMAIYLKIFPLPVYFLSCKFVLD